MNSVFYEELRKVNQAIQEKNLTEKEKEVQPRELLECGLSIIQLSTVARKEGLLALEDAYTSLDDSKEFHKFLKLFGELIVDGTDPELIESIGYNTYFSELLEDYPALEFLIVLNGMLAIQAGENPRVIEAKIKSMLPATQKESYVQFMEDFYNGKSVSDTVVVKDPETEIKEIMERLKSQEFGLSPDDSQYFVVKLADITFQRLDDKSIQRIFRDTENHEITELVYIFSGEANKRIFDNLSERLGKMIAADTGYVYGKSHSVTAAQNLMQLILNLHLMSEIIFPEGNLIGSLFQYFKEDYRVIQERNKKKQMEVKEIEELFAEFRDALK